ncbi:MAG: phosphoribosylformylglycinamidine synthase subunit PurQ, partial [Desulfuromonadaceae bacterium]|nr:phosphoribosylformylglycinamidine synthase subunit PurQ [Desulfuromonadaceae bacterium]
MKQTRAIVITGNGTNCEMEAAHACKLGGFDETVIAHIAEILSGDIRLDDFHFLNLTGGFLDGDDLGSAKAQANRLKNASVVGTDEKLVEQFTRFISNGKLILGVCNGFQLMVKMGMLPGFDGNYLQQTVTLTHNDCGRFQHRWTCLKVDSDSPCVFTNGIANGIYL